MLSQFDLLSKIFECLEDLGFGKANTRQYNAVIEAADIIVAAFNTENKPATPGMGVQEWLASDDTGLSSKYLCCSLSGTFLPSVHYPRDSADFGRCVRMLDAAPELRKKLPLMTDARHGPVWVAMVAEWDKLEALYYEELPSGSCRKLYRRMENIIAEATGEDKS